MELKQYEQRKEDTENQSFNRTFMELKLMGHRDIWGSNPKVLIVPLWN